MAKNRILSSQPHYRKKGQNTTKSYFIVFCADEADIEAKTRTWQESEETFSFIMIKI